MDFTSPGMKIDNGFQRGGGPPNIRIYGQSCQRIGSMLSFPGNSPKFSHLYIYDTGNKIQNMIQGLGLISERSIDDKIYKQPIVSKVAALIVGDVDTGSKRDILLERQSGRLKIISKFHPSYLAYQYPLLFPYDEDGFRLGVLHRETNKKRKQKE
ncbi:hypothetical protein KIW84_043257 [Lathyrus oleraceus]|uniref:Uncharacterized protein n=1 Tax=Pisum sativum TaxID=3888 RepID=A0A9D5AUF8_PEA|nr:hypothetical protein KIW84_043257 [Pisum sativum]